MRQTLAKRPRVAGLISEYRRYSHGQNIIDRLMGGYGWENQWHYPELDVVSLYVDQFPESDLSREREQRHPDLHIYPSIAEALTLGGDELAVDGVVLIAEHGDYPRNERGQKLYPRYEFFQQITSVFRTTGKTAPVFCDKHLSYDWNRARQMYDTSQELGFAFMAGSSLPVTSRVPAIDIPLGASVEEAMCMASAGDDGGDIHALEAIYAILGPGFLTCRNTGTKTQNVVHFTHGRGADVVVVVSKDMFGGFGYLTLCGTHGSVQLKSGDSFFSFKSQLDDYVRYLRTGVRSYPFSETVELMRMVIAGIESRQRDGALIEIT